MDPAAAAVEQANKEEVDSRSVFVGNVDYACTPEEVQQHFQSCGTVNRVTIRTNRFGQPKGYAYVEFVEPEAIQEAIHLNESELHGRQLKVSTKRTNIPGMKQFRPRRPNPYTGAFGFRGPYPTPYLYPSGYGKVPRFRMPMRYDVSGVKDLVVNEGKEVLLIPAEDGRPEIGDEEDAEGSREQVALPRVMDLRWAGEQTVIREGSSKPYLAVAKRGQSRDDEELVVKSMGQRREPMLQPSGEEDQLRVENWIVVPGKARNNEVLWGKRGEAIATSTRLDALLHVHVKELSIVAKSPESVGFGSKENPSVILFVVCQQIAGCGLRRDIWTPLALALSRSLKIVNVLLECSHCSLGVLAGELRVPGNEGEVLMVAG
ncbi:hypothetical protein Dimus_002946 [Dionaea muscipula]